MHACKMACVLGMRAVISSSASFSWYNHTVFEFSSFLFLYFHFFCLPVATRIPCGSKTEVRHEPWDISCLGEGYRKLLLYYYPLPFKSYEICKTYLASLPPSSVCTVPYQTYVRVWIVLDFNPYPTAFPYGNGMVLHFYQQQESSTTKTVHKVINKRLKTYV